MPGDPPTRTGTTWLFEWGLYPVLPEVLLEPGSGAPRDRAGHRTVIAPERAGKTIPSCSPSPTGVDPRLTRYGRVLIRVERAE